MKKILLMLFFTSLFNHSVFAITADEIVKKAEQAAYYQGKDGLAKVTMKISDGRQRQFIILRKNYDDDQKFYVYFKRPTDVRKMAFLVHKHKKQTDNRWMYLPALDLVKRIAAGDKRTSFVGSHFFYEDVSGRNPNDDIHKIDEISKNFYVIKSTPKKPQSVEFSYYKTWIHKTTFIPIQTSYFNQSNQEYRQYITLKVEEMNGFKTITNSVIKNLITGEKTELVYLNVQYNIGLEDQIFTERYLKSPPKKWLR